MVLQVQGVDYESLDTAGQEYAVKRLISALKALGKAFMSTGIFQGKPSGNPVCKLRRSNSGGRC